ncbi:hypothetical protein PtA15_7A252 [Puccinia triticina]|uniref:Anaphase-promoting complex subunit cdc27 n=1 Tax=Puccinia triticina TaxID=208348 RepID=A0ABY7CMS0_9BASI|nr:uncharacterized protein PtA15_7A252 [Puccinia triticina]WAQ86526.1 hypothetical protein PtA15_7A252 [Puccinia triticina]
MSDTLYPGRMRRPIATATTPKQPSNSLINLLVSIIINLLRSDLIQSALFFSERLHALIPSSELATWLLSLCLLRAKDYQATVHLLRNAPIFIPNLPPTASNHQQQQHPQQSNSGNQKGKGKLLDEDPFNFHSSPAPAPKKQDNSIFDQSPKGTQRPANLASTRCALVYSKACSLIDRPKEGLEVYLQAIDEFGMSSAEEVSMLNSTFNSDQSTSSAYTHLATLSYQSHEYEKANRFYRKALEATSDGHLCWEAFEGLCQTVSAEEDVDPEEIFCVKDFEHFLPGYMELDDQYIICTSKASTNTRQPSSLPIISNAPIKPKPPPLAPKDAFRIMGNNGLYRHKQMLIDNSFGESSRNSSFAVNSFDRPCYAPKQPILPPNQRAPQPKSNHTKMELPSTPNLNHGSPLPPRSFNFALGEPPRHRSDSVYNPVPISSTPNLRHGFEHNHLSSANHPPPMPAPSPLSFTGNPYAKSPCDYPSPLPAMDQQGRGLVSVKRTRSQTQSQDLSRSSTSAPTSTATSSEIHLTNTQSDGSSKVNSQPTTSTTATATTATTQPQTPKLANGRLLSRREMIDSGRLLKVAGLRETKRVKSGTNLVHPDRQSTPSVASDRPPSSFPPHTSSSFNPAAPLASRFRRDKIEAINWVKDLLFKLAAAQLALARFKSQDALDSLAALPTEQKRSWRIYCLIGRARFEMLDYKSAEIAFRKARECFPHLVTHMDIYSTLLWHLRKTTTLSYLSQELQLINPGASETWIATGNLFSRLDDHPNALKCFQRSTQLSRTESYGYTLSGHESLMLSEYSRSLVFFRESIRRNSRSNYNAFFGLGECFFKQDRFRLALFFFNHARVINPHNPLILAGVAKVYQAVGNLNLALNVFNLAIDHGHSSVASVRFSRAKILFELGHLEDAKEDLIKLIDLVPTEFNVRFLLGKIYGRLKNHREAIKHLTYAVDLEPKAVAVVKKIISDFKSTSFDQSGSGGH